MIDYFIGQKSINRIKYPRRREKQSLHVTFAPTPTSLPRRNYSNDAFARTMPSKSIVDPPATKVHGC